MVDLPKLDNVGLASVLAGFIFLMTGILLLVNTATTVHDPVNPSLLNLVGLISTLVGLVLILARDETARDMRQVSPFAGVLSASERAEILRRFRKDWSG